MFQKCTSGHIEATQLDVVDIVRKIIHTGNTVVTKRKTAAKGESQFVVKQNIFDEFDDGFNGLLTGSGGAFDFSDEKDVGNSNNKQDDLIKDIFNLDTPTKPTTTPTTTTTTTKVKDVVDADVVGQFKNTEEVVGIKVNNKVTTCVSEIEVCCKILPAPPVDPPTTPTPPTSPFIPVPAPKCGIRNEDGLLITAEFPSDGRAR